MLAYRTTTGSVPTYFHSFITIYISSRSLRSESERRLVRHHREAQNHSPERFHSLFLAGGMNFPPPSGMLNSWQFSSDTWKLISSIITWLNLKNNPSLSFLNFVLFPLTSHCLSRICSEQCVEICIISTSYYYLLIMLKNNKTLF